MFYLSTGVYAKVKNQANRRGQTALINSAKRSDPLTLRNSSYQIYVHVKKYLCIRG